MFKVGKGAAVTSSLAVAALALAACSGGSSGGSSSSGPKTLTIWHYESPDSAMGTAWAEAVTEFKAAHPGVTVKVEEKGFEQIQKTAPMVLNSKDAPDVMEYNKGNATAGLLSKQGLLTDLSAQVTKFGWDKLVPSSVATTCQYDGKGVMGSGKWYGITNYAEYLTVYYNKDMFAKYNIAVPTTFDQLTAAMATFVKNGITPFANSGAEYLGQQYLYQLALSKADRTWVNAYERYTGKVDFHDAAWTYAANTFSDWVKKGYIAKNSSGMKAEDAGVAFISGKYPMLFSGTWWAGRFETQVKFGWGSFLWPESKLTLGSGGNLWVVPTASKSKSLAYDFINLTMQKKAQNTLGNHGGVPVAADATAITDPVAKSLIQDYSTLSSNDSLAFYPDWPVAGFYDVLVSETQKLITGSAQPSTVLDDLQKAYNAGLPS